MKKLGIAGLVVVLISAFFLADLHHYLTLEGMQAGMAQFTQWQAQQPLMVAFGFFVAYVLVTALSLPGAAVMTLAAGALFGLGWGLLLVSFASSIGATLAFLVARYLLRDRVEQYVGDRLRAINQGLARDGAFYLFTLRLVPVFPFFLINLLMGLTTIPTRTFYAVSQVGMLLGTLVYINAGTQLAQLDTLQGLVSPTLLLSFALLGLFPWLARWGLAQWQRRRVYAGFTRPRRFDRNLIVIGAGAGGLVTAYIAAAVKARVTLVEAKRMGGDCLNTGCVPSKALIKSARVAQQLREAAAYGVEGCTPRVDFRRVMARVRESIRAIEPHDSIERYTGLGVDVRQGHARLLDPWTVEITPPEGAPERLTARAIVLATGAAPVLPDVPGLAQLDPLTSETLWEHLDRLDQLPPRLLVLGAGPIGCELAQAFAQLGSQVTLVDRGARVLKGEDPEVSQLVEQRLRRDGVELLTGWQPQQGVADEAGKRLILQRGEDQREVGFDLLLCATGRRARMQGFGLEALGIETDRVIPTNGYLETRYPNLYAVGDAAGPYQLTHAAAHQAWYAAVNALFGQFKRFRADYRVIPQTTFVAPEVARVGLNEQQARAQGIAYEVTRYAMDDLDRAIVDGCAEGFVKVLTAPGKDRILGVVIVGEQAGELLAEYVLAMKQQIGLNRLLGTIHAYPTLAEANKYAAGEWKRAHAPQNVLRWVARYQQWRRG